MNTLTSEEQNRMVVETIDLVGHIVSELSARYPKHVDRSELWNAGALGLVEASRRFDPESGVPFARYAAIRIRGAIIDSTRSRDWASRSVRRRAREVSQAAHDLEEAHGKAPSVVEVASFLGIDVDELQRRRSRALAATLLHLDQPLDGEDGTLGDRLEEQGESGASPESILEQREMRGTLAAAVRNLPAVQAEVISRYYVDGELMQAIADDLGLTEPRVSQIRIEALAALRAYFATQYEDVEVGDQDTPGKRSRAAYLEKMAKHSEWRERLDAATFMDAAVQGLASLLAEPGPDLASFRRD